MADQSIAGEWRGRYRYDMSPDMGADFSIWFTETADGLEGTVAENSSAGNASLKGSFSFPIVQFTKLYLKPSVSEKVKKEKTFEPKHKFKFFNFQIGIGKENVTTTTTKEHFGDPVEYEGKMSDDGRTLEGIWTLKSQSGAASSGTWTATRAETASNE
jgi:hypothetical protein